MKSGKPRLIIVLSLLCALLCGGCENIKIPSGAQKTSGTDANATSVSESDSQMSSSSTDSVTPTPQPAFSEESGFYTDEFELSISSPEDTAKIYYTLDGSDPRTSATRIEYLQPLTIYDKSVDENVLSAVDPLSISVYYDETNVFVPSEKVEKCTVVRACAVENEISSEVITKTYFIGKTSAMFSELPIISMSTDAASLFDEEKGIYVTGKVFAEWRKANPDATAHGLTPANYNQRGREWEREVHIDYFESDGSFVFSQDCGVRIQGGWSRAEYQKSFRFYARSDYGKKNFNYAFLTEQENSDGEILDKYDTFVLRNGGNDSRVTKFRDAFVQTLIRDRNVATQQGRPCILFIDGEYWGLYTLQSDYTDDYFADVYGVDKNEVIFFKNNKLDIGVDEKAEEVVQTENDSGTTTATTVSDEPAEEDIPSDTDLYYQMIYYARHYNLSSDKNYAVMCSMLDIDSFIDYVVAELYLNNTDWPENNFGMWRTRTVDPSNEYADGRWRMCVFDTDLALNLVGSSASSYKGNSLEELKETASDVSTLFNALIENEDFKQQFVTVFMDLTYTIFDADYAKTILYKLKNQYLPELADSFARFNTLIDAESAEISTYMAAYFLENRASYTQKMIRKELELEEKAVDITVEVNEPESGTVRLNTVVPDTSSGSWSGKYFPEYEIVLTAQPEMGYNFIGWTGDVESTDETISVSFSEAMTFRAVFEKQ